MAAGGRWIRNRKGTVCQVCGEDNGWCARSESGAVDCMKAHGQEVAGWKMVKMRVGVDGNIHSVYRAVGDERGLVQEDPEARRKRKETERRYRDNAARMARELWESCAKDRIGDEGGADHPLMRAYFEARGIELSMLPGGKLPMSLRLHPRTPYKGPLIEGGPEVEAELPAVLGLGQRYARVVRAGLNGEKIVEFVMQSRCVQRIYLDPVSGGRKKLGVEAAKKGLGPFGGDDEDEGEGGGGTRGGGAAVRLSGPSGNGTLVLCEGIETGVAILAACRGKVEVWACISAGGLIALRLPPTRVAPSAGGEAEDGVGITRVVIAADLDHINKMGTRTGETAARIAANGLRGAWKGLRVEVALPHRGLHEALERVIDERGEIVNARSKANPDGVKSVDWLDVLKIAGAEAVVKGVMGEGGLCVPPPASLLCKEAVLPLGGGGDGADGHDGIMPESRMGRARLLLSMMQREFGGEDGAGGDEGVLRLRWYGAAWWVWVAPGQGVPRWKMVSPEKIEAIATKLMDGFNTVKRGKVGKFMPLPADVKAALLAAINYVDVPAEEMPCWLAPQVDGHGRVEWEGTLRFGDGDVQGPIAAENVVAFRNGLLDVDAWVDGRVELLSPTSRWFSRSCLPFDLPVDEVRKAEEEGETEALLQRMCPTWLKFLQHASDSGQGPDEEWQDQLCRWFGYCLTSDVSLERILWLQGDPGTGKGTVCRALESVVGRENYASSSLDALAGKFDLAAFVGRNVVVVPELRVGPMTNMAGALDRVNSISGGDPQSVEDKFQRKQSNVRILAKFIFTPNEEPKMTDPSNAILRRLLVLPMGDPPARPDPTLKGKILAEAEGIMLWSLYGLRALRLAVREGRPAFVEPKAGTEIRDEIRRAAAPVRAYLDDCCERERDGVVGTTELYAGWNDWRKSHGHQEMTQQTFGRHLRVSGWKIRKSERMMAGVRFQVYKGVAFKAGCEPAESQPPSNFWPGDPAPRK